MSSPRLAIAAGLFLILVPAAVAREAPSYAKQVRPFLAKYCVECHTGPDADGELSFDTFQSLMKGGTHGPAVVPGVADRSPLVLNVEGKARPLMPPKNAKLFPNKDERAILRAWVDAGARDDGGPVVAALPPISPKAAVPSPVTALAFRPDGGKGGGTPPLLAAGVHNAVLLLDPLKGEVVGKLGGQNGQVTALAFSGAGLGEVRLYRTEGGALPAGPPRLTLPAHKDVVLGLDFSPDGSTLATCGYD